MISRRLRPPFRLHCGLVDDAGLATNIFAEHVQCGTLQDYDASCDVNRLLRFPIYWKIVINIGSREGDDQRPFWMCLPESLNTGMTPPSMQRDQQIARFIVPFVCDGICMSKCLQNIGPPVRRNAVPQRRVTRGRTDNDDLHDSKAQVRNPAQISRRSGI